MAYITSKEVAEKLGMSHSHMRLLIRQGEIKGIKIGRDWLVEDDSVDYKRKRKPKSKSVKQKNP